MSGMHNPFGVNRCATCKWWTDSRYCDSPKVLTDGGKPDADGARAGGYEGYGDYFMTGPEFGCVQHEARAVPHTGSVA